MIGRGTAAPGRNDETNRLRFEATNRTVHCYAAGRNGAWEAICLEFDIAVQGNAFEEVFSSLQHAISLYTESVANLPPGERGGLLHRPAPLSVRLRFFTHGLRCLFSDSEDGTQRHQFTMTVAARAFHRNVRQGSPDCRIANASVPILIQYEPESLGRSEAHR
jgi:predicted RNase H-like HicB family nuclease